GIRSGTGGRCGSAAARRARSRKLTIAPRNAETGSARRTVPAAGSTSRTGASRSCSAAAAGEARSRGADGPPARRGAAPAGGTQGDDYGTFGAVCAGERFVPASVSSGITTGWIASRNIVTTVSTSADERTAAEESAGRRFHGERLPHPHLPKTTTGVPWRSS